MKCWVQLISLFVAASALASAPQPKFVFPTSSRCLCDTVWNLNYRTNNGALKTFKVDPKNELTNAFNAALNYDGSGNLTNANGGTNAYIYDDENRLIQWYSYQAGAPATDGDLASEFVYDGLGRLRDRWEYVWNEATSPIGASWRWTSTTRYVYDGWRVIQERDTNNTPLVSYTRGSDLSAPLLGGAGGGLEGAGGIGGLLARSHGYASTNGNWYTHNFYHADGKGNVTYLVDSAQALAASYRYDPFGNLISSSGSLASANVYRFSSKEIHVNSGMYYYGQRFYDPNLQRWLNRDPIQEWGGINLYGFVGNNPLSYADPYGNDLFNPFTWFDPPGLQISPNGDMSMPPLPLPDPNTFGAMHGMNTDFMGGQRPGDFVANNAMQAAKDSAMAMAMLTPLGEEEGAAEAAGGLWKALKNKLLKRKCPPKAPKFKDLKAGLDATSRVHGTLPKPNELGRYHPEDLQSLLAQLRQSGQRRIENTANMGSNLGHDARLAEEQQLIQAIEKHLGGGQ